MDCSITTIHFLFFFFSAEELLAQNGFRQMYDMSSGFFERKVWHVYKYDMRIKM
jgi:hypothetical protein